MLFVEVLAKIFNLEKKHLEHAFLRYQKRPRIALKQKLIFIVYFLISFLGIFRRNIQKYQKVDVVFDVHIDESRLYNLYHAIIKNISKPLDCFFVERPPLGPFKNETVKNQENYFIFSERGFAKLKYCDSSTWHNLFKSFWHFIFSEKRSLSNFYYFLNEMIYVTSLFNRFPCDNFITCREGFLSPLLFALCEKQSRTLIAIQHGWIPWETEISYGYAEHFFVYGKQQERFLKNQCHISAKKFHPIGNIALQGKVEDLSSPSLIYDICFIEKIYHKNTKYYFNEEDYFLLIEHFKRYLVENPGLKAVYVVREDVRRKGRPKVLDICQKLDYAFRGFDNIEISTSSYEKLIKSKVVINYTSTLGFEAIGLEKFVLNCDFGIMKLFPDQDTAYSLVSKDYHAFSNALNFLRSPSNKLFLKKMFLSLKEEHMNQKKYLFKEFEAVLNL